MQITDLDFNHSTEFTVEVDDCKTADVKIADFMAFMSAWKGWPYDADNGIIVVPHQLTSYEADNEIVLLSSLSVSTYDFESFRKRHAVEISDFVFEYISDADIVWEEEEYDPTVETAQEEAWRDFRRAQMI